MKKIFIIFSVLLIAFVGAWAVKASHPVNRPDSYATGLNAEDGAWWNISLGTDNVDGQWILDPEIPDNYIPVPGEDELYMVIDDSGNILQYRHRVKQDDGSWLWEDISPDIPENYEAVSGLRDVYKVTDENGSTLYYKYVRNDDNTFLAIQLMDTSRLIMNTNILGIGYVLTVRGMMWI